MLTPEFLAIEAERLTRDPVLVHAIGLMRTEAVEMLIETDPDDFTEICRWQAQARMADEIPMMLRRFVAAQASDE
jgi:hypothetical protein